MYKRLLHIARIAWQRLLGPLRTLGAIALGVGIGMGLFWLLSDIRRGADGPMVTYTVQAGKQNFRPFENPLPLFDIDSVTVRAVFDSTAWWSLAEWDGDRDYFDWNKLSGLTGFLSANNSRTVMYAYRPDTAAYVMQVAAYTNDAAGAWQVGPTVRVPCGELFTGTIKWEDEHVYYQYGEHRLTRALPRSFITRLVGTWIGGGNNAQGPFGGRAHRAMTLHLSTTLR